jgi:hypothetical protein
MGRVVGMGGGRLSGGMRLGRGDGRGSGSMMVGLSTLVYSVGGWKADDVEFIFAWADVPIAEADDVAKLLTERKWRVLLQPMKAIFWIRSVTDVMVQRSSARLRPSHLRPKSSHQIKGRRRRRPRGR